MSSHVSNGCRDAGFKMEGFKEGAWSPGSVVHGVVQIPPFRTLNSSLLRGQSAEWQLRT